MIVVSLDMWPSGSEESTYPLGRMYLANQESRTLLNAARGDYLVAVCRRGTRDVPSPVDPTGPQPTRSGLITNYPRQSYNVWRLIARALHVTFPEETSPNTKPAISPEVLRGLRALSDSGVISAHPDIVAAREWIAAADGNGV